MSDEQATAAARILAARRRPLTGVCPHCGRPWTGTNPAKVYCGRRCKFLAWQRRNRRGPRPDANL